MITFYVPGEKGAVPADLGACADLASRSTWIDLFEPTREEELAVEQALGINVPTREEMRAIELSRRLYREKDLTFMTATILTRSDTRHPESSAITFVLGPQRLLTVRYASPVAFTLFANSWASNGQEYASASKVFVGLLDAIVERLADILEHTGAALDDLSLEVLSEGTPGDAETPRRRRRKKQSTQRDFKVVLRRIGRSSDLASRARESLVSLGRVIAHVREVHKDLPNLQGEMHHLHTVAADLTAMSDHASFLSGKVSFLLDATLGLINNDQNSIIKIVSVATLVFLPPTLVASIYGMNFEHMPELKWLLGYPGAIGMMIVSAILPYVLFKRKGWL